MPIDPFAALNALLRAEAARADAPEIRRRPAPATTQTQAATDSTAPADQAAAETRHDESTTPA
ncbi:hypothetical protein [Streptomyces liangshanensis]|uniref:Uncharacterized protein n=1 Tax=Streptomyces liangshanensis TaxID=2717324 RepID=A0A6G9GRL2_9ACTN|nr:hypothetical protein [Streptomyces liangshanensis]QIQ00882.1 hypothetical protein HA039_05220 [Streptomyces liangshanensis]